MQPIAGIMLRKLASPFQEFGPISGALYVLGNGMARLSSRLRLYVYDLMVQPIQRGSLLPERWLKKLEVREIKPGDLELAAMPVRPDVMRSRLDQKAVCLGAFKQEQLVGYMWFCFREYEEDEVRCTYALSPPAEAVFDFDFYIFPDHRLGLAFASLWNGANEYLSARGIKYTFSRLTRFNVASRRAHDHLGWKIVGRAIFLQAWRVEVMLATLFPFFWVTSTVSGRVRLTLRPDVLQR
jgi:hypothetical protein